MIVNADSYQYLDTLSENSIDTVITDPPYGLKFMGKKWDYDIPRKDFWEKVYRVCKPGSIMLVFGGTRTYHRLAVEIEDAGFEIRDCIMWLYGQGFPKSYDISKGIDKYLGNDRTEFTIDEGYLARNPISDHKDDYQETSGNPSWKDGIESAKRFKPSSDEAQLWDGWGTALKPAWESVIIAQKPNYRLDILLSVIDLENRLWSLLPVELAETHFKLSNQELSTVQNTVQWNVEELQHIQVDLLDQMDTLQFVTVMYSCLNTVRSWRNILIDHYNQTNMYTIETEISKIIDWKTCKLSLSQITVEYIIRGAMNQHGIWQYVFPVVKSFQEELMKLIDTKEPIAVEYATEKYLIPNFEPIIVAMKPLEGTYAENALKYGVAGLNIDGSRIGTELRDKRVRTNNKVLDGDVYGSGINGSYADGYTDQGRFPANIILDEDSAALLDEQSGELKSGANKKGSTFAINKGGYAGGKGTITLERDYLASKGGASRFFYVAKASRSERDRGLDETVSTGHRAYGDYKDTEDHGTNMTDTQVKNNHPTVKPIALLEYLCKLTETPTKGIILDPFMGSGSLGIAAHNTDREYLGIEIDEHYFEIAKKRIDACKKQ